MPLSVIGHLTVPAAAIAHRHIGEALLLSRYMRRRDAEGVNRIRGGLIGTSDNRRVEVYAWTGAVGQHADTDFGPRFIYLCPIVAGGRTLVHVGGTAAIARPGAVIRLDDSVVHWTSGLATTVALQVGCWSEPADAVAMESFRRAIHLLAAGCLTAERVAPGFRGPFSPGAAC